MADKVIPMCHYASQATKNASYNMNKSSTLLKVINSVKQHVCSYSRDIEHVQ